MLTRFCSNINLKNSVLVLLLPIFTLFASNIWAQKCPNYPNKYGLKIISCFQDYQREVKLNRNNELVDLEKQIPTIKLEIRYATTLNFTGKIIYSKAKAYTRYPVAMALKSIQDSLAYYKLGLKIFDAYRPYSASEKFFKVYPDTNFVANPRYGSRHNRGCAIDLTLINLSTGKELAMPTEFDDFSNSANPQNMNFSKEILQNRTFLFKIMAHFGFLHNSTEWWHFDYTGWERYSLMDLQFEMLSN
jgi:D-alanyl-D-alanine dipeptidase